VPKAEALSAGDRFVWFGETLTVVGPPYVDRRSGNAEIVISCVDERNRNRVVRVRKGRTIRTL